MSMTRQEADQEAWEEMIASQKCFCFYCSDNTNYYYGEDAIECMTCHNGDLVAEEDILGVLLKVTNHTANKDHNATVKKGDYYCRTFYRVTFMDGKDKIINSDTKKTLIKKGGKK